MDIKTFKYSKFISGIQNCPDEECGESDKNAFRWVHATPSSSDFIPLRLMPEVNMRAIDETDFEKHCKSYGLSLFDTLENARREYIAIYNRQPHAKKIQYIEEKGDMVAFIRLRTSHGVSSKSNKRGHFTLYEYEGKSLDKEIKDFFNIFESNGESGNDK